MSVATNQNDPGITLSPDLREVRDPVNLSLNDSGLEVKAWRNPLTRRWNSNWTVSKDLAITPSPAGVQSFAVIPRSGASFAPSDAGDAIALAVPDQFTVRDIKFNVQTATISAGDDVCLFARLNGKDSTLTTEGNLRVITGETEVESQGGGGSSQESALRMRLNFYVKKDIKLSTYNQTVFKELKLEGLVYTWGNFVAMLGDTVSGSSWANFELRGALVAYGADPASESPGSAGSGQIQVAAKQAKIIWDDREMAGMNPETSGSTLRRILYNGR
jgi:hypothetical protein